MRQRAWVIGTTLAAVVAVASCSASEGPSRPLLAPQDPERTEIGQAKSAITVPLETENWEIVRMPTRRSPPSYVYDPLRGEGTLFGNSFAEDSKSTWVWNGHNFLEYVTRRGMKTPGARFGPALAWDPERKNVVLFGGNDSNLGFQSDTWTWNGRSWTEVVSSVHPSPRANANFFWDPERKNLVLYGDGGTLSDTWTFNGSRWSFAYDELPPPRADASLAWDPVRKNIVLFGGQSTQLLNDTWLWNGTEWRAANSLVPPSARSRPSLTWDDVGKKMVLFGGARIGASTGETTVFDGKNWAPISGAQPPNRSGPNAAWDDARRQIVLFGGTQPNGLALDDTWTFHQDHWVQVATTGSKPPGRGNASFTWDPQRRSLFLLGGDSGFTNAWDAWYWDGARWSVAASEQRPQARESTAMVYDRVRQQVVMFGGAVDSFDGPRPTGDTWVWNGFAWTQMTQAGPRPKARSGHTLVWDDARKQVVMFGGADFPDYFNDTWVWNGTQWTEKVATEPPGPRTEGLMGFDPASQRVVLVGGTTQFGTTNEVSVWDGAQWKRSRFTTVTNGIPFTMGIDEARKQLVVWQGGLQTWIFQNDEFQWVRSASTPPNMASSTFTWDPIRKNLILIGSSGAAFMDVWAWDGASWTDRSNVSATRIPRRTNHLAYWDPARRAVTISGGFGNNGRTDDTWTYDGTSFRLIQPSASAGDSFPSGTLDSSADLVMHEARARALLLSRGSGVLADGNAVSWSFHTRGGSCSDGTQCASGFCVDGVCCEQAACGPCETCADPNEPGRCTSVTLSEDADSCPASERKICNRDGVCTRTLGAECKESADCASGFCVSPFPGSPMVGPNKGVCCDKACNGLCEACAAGLKLSQKDDGTCGAANVGTNPGLFCPGDLSCNSAGACAPEPTAYCKNRSTAVSKLGEETPCGRYACERGVCLSRCASDAQCGLARRCSVDGYCDLGSDSGCAVGPGKPHESADLGALVLFAAALGVGTARKRNPKTQN